MSIVDDYINRVHEEQEKEQRHQKVLDYLYGGEQNAPLNLQSKPTTINGMGRRMFTGKANRNATMQEAHNQLGKTGWNDLQNDLNYRRELGVEMVNTQRALNNYNPDTASVEEWWQNQHQQQYMDYLRKMQDAYQQREQYAGQFRNEEEYNWAQEAPSSLESAHANGQTNREWAQTIRGNYTISVGEMEELDEEVRRLENLIPQIEAGYDEYSQPISYDEAQRLLAEKQAELEDKRKQLETARANANKYNYQRRFADAWEYDDLPQMPDWESSVAAGQAEVDALQQQVEAGRAQRASETRQGNTEVAGLSDEELSGEDWYTYRMPQAHWTQDQRDTYAYLYHDENRREEAYQYAIAVNQAYRARVRQEQMQQFQDWAGQNALTRTAAFGYDLLSMPTYLWDVMGDWAQYGNTGLIMPDTELSPSDWADAMNAGASLSLNEKYGTLGDEWGFLAGKGVGDLFGLGESIAESAVAVVGGGGLANLLFFGKSAKQGTEQALARGATPQQALVMGAASGAAEVLGETFSIEHLVHITDTGTMRRLLWNALKQGGIEASEEAFTTILNTAADALVMGDKSELNEKIRQNMLSGMSQEEAEKAAWTDWANGVLADALGGFISGGLSGAGKMGINNIRGSRVEYSGSDRQALLDAALQMDQKSPAYALAQRIQQNGTMSVNEATRLRELMGDTGTRVTDRQTEQDRAGWQQRAETALQAAGVENPGAAAELIAKEVMGEELTRDERRVLKGVQQAGQVSQALQEQRRTEESFRHITAQQAREEIREQRKAARKGGKTNAGAGVTGSTSIRTADPNSAVKVKGQEGEAKIQNLTRNESGELVAKVVNAAGETQTVGLDALDYGESGLGELVDELRDRKDAPLMFAAYSPDMSIGTFINGWNVATLYGKNSSRASYESILNDPLLEGMSPGAVKIAFNYGRSLQQQEREQRAKERAEKEKREKDPSTSLRSAQDDSTPSVSDASAEDTSLKEGGKREGGKGGVSYEGGELDGYKLKGVNRSRLNPRQRAQIGAVDMFGKSLGVRFVLFESDSSNRFINGMYKDGVIYLDVNAGQHGRSLSQIAIVRTAAHELTHWMQDYAEERYDELKQFLIDHLIEWKGKSLGELAAQKLQRDRSGKLTEEGALDEVVADGCEMMLRRSKVMQAMAEENKGLFRTVKGWLQKWLGTIKEAFQGVSEVHEEARAVAEMEAERLEKLVELWDKGIREAAENAAKGPARTGGAVRYSWGDAEGVANRKLSPINGELRDSLLSYKENIIVDSHKEVVKMVNRAFDNVDVKETGYFGIINQDELKQIQDKATNVAKDLQGRLFKENSGYILAVTSDSIRHLNEEKNLSKKEIVELLDRLADIVLDNDTVKFSYYLQRGQKIPGLIFEKTFSDGTYGAFNLISGKRRRLGLQTMYVEGRDTKIRKSPLTPLLVNTPQPTSKTTGSQAPSEYSILSSSEKSNTKMQEQTETPQFKQWFGNSKLVNEDGTPKVFYHGTNTEFWTFDKKKAQDKTGRLLGLGAGKGKFYLTEYQGSAAMAAEGARARTGKGETRVMPLYVRAEKVMPRAEYTKLLEENYKKFPNSKPGSAQYDYTQRDKAIAATDKEIRSKGYDAVYDAESGELFVYEPNQMKSATDNIGTFDRNNPDIRYQERDALPDDRELLMTVKAEGKNGELLEKHHKKVRALEALYRKLQRQQEALESAKKREVVDAEGKKLDPKQQKEFQRSTEKAVQEQIQKTEAQIRRAEQALDEMERSPQLRQELDKALAAWREANPTEAAKAIREMQQERESLKAYVKLLQQEAKLTTPENRRMLPSDVRKMAQALVKQMGSTAAVDSISEKLQKLGDFMVSNMEGGDVSYYNRMVAEARKIAREIVEESYETIDDNKELREGIRGYLRGHTLNLEELRGEIPDLEAWRRSHMGTLRLGKDGMSIDQAYQDLRSEYGEGLFPSDVLSAYDQMQQILDALDRVQPSFRQMFSQYESWQAAEALGNEIIDRLLSGEVRERESMADRAFEQKMRQLEEKYARKDKARQKALEDAEDQMKWERARRDEAEERRREERALRRQLVSEKVHELRERSIERDKRYKARISIDKKVVSLSKIMLENSGKRHVPDAWKESIGGFLASIDTLTQHSGEGSRSFHLERIEALRDMVARQQAMNEGREKAGESQGPEAFIDVNPYLEEMLKPFIKMARDSSTGFITVENLELSQMRELEEILVALREAVDKADVMLADREKGKISENAGEFVSYAEGRGKGKTGGMLRRFLSWDNLTPVYFFRRFGESGERVFRGLQRGWGKLAMNARQIIDYSEKSYSAKEAKAWEKETHEFKLIKRESDLSGRESLTKAAKEGGPEAVKAAEEKNKDTVTLSTAQIMGLYCLSKREQARGHILAGGIRIWDINAKKGTVEQAERYLVSAEDLATITGSLTERQREVADKLQTYMNTVGSAWGNEVSRARFGVDLFTEKNYYPIQTDEKSRNAKNPEADGTDLFHILNMGFTKNTVKNAKNGVVLHSIFDVFANHMADMAKYNAMGLPMLDAMKWFNYRDESGGQFVSVRASMEKAFGKNAERYFLAFMQDLNGSFEGGRRGEDVASRMISHAKVASVGANLRVAALQPTSYVRALAVLDPKYLLKGENPARIRQGMREALQYSGTAVWKDLGFFDININANMRDMIKHTDGTMEKIREASMIGAELGDKMTWGKIWNACKAEVREKTGLSGEALLQAAAERFDDVIYQTQVMDSTMTRSHLMRQRGVFASMATSFMSEPILSYNLVLDAVTHWQDAKKRGAGVREAGKLAARAFITYGLSQIAASVVESFFSALRDDDDYEDLWEKWKQSEFGWDGNLMQDLFLHNKLPYVRDVVSILEGFTNKRMDTEWVEDLTRAYKALKRDFEEGELRWGTAYSVMNALSTMTGLPISNAARDGVALWNSIVVQSVPDWKLKNIKRGTVRPEASIKQAYQSGALSEEDAIRYLMRDAGIESEEKARQTIYEWSLEKGEGKYDQLLDAVRSGDSTAAGRAIETLRENGYSESMIQSAVRTNVKTWYQGTDESGKPRMNKQAAIDALVQYGGMRRREAEETVQEWTCYVSSPEKLQYDDIREAYLNGEISAERAAEMQVLFGGKREAAAAAEVNEWRCEKETGIKYEELDDAYLDGEISQEEAVEYRVRYGGQKRAEAEAEVNKWRCEKETGIKYSEIRDAYLDKEITGSQARDMMMRYGGKSEDDAEGELLKYDFAGRNPELQDISAKAATDYYVYLSSSGISRQTWYTAWKTMNGMESDKDANGKTVSGSLMNKRMEYIDSLNLTPKQKDLLFLTQYDEKYLRKTPWHQ